MNKLFIVGSFCIFALLHSLKTYANKPGIINNFFFSDTSYSISSGGIGNSVCQGTSVTFSLITNQSSIPTGYTFQWRLNGSNISGANQKNYSPTNSGNYTLIISRPNGDTVVNAPPLTINTNPSVDFSFFPLTECSGIPINFSPIVTGTIVSYNWDFNDGNNSNTTSPSHGFITNYGNGSQTFSVKLRVTDNNNCSNEINKSIIIKQRPEAAFAGDTTECSGLSSATFSFFNSSSTTSINTNYRFIWGDGTPDLIINAFTSSATHSYNIGLNTITQIVTGSNGCKDTVSKTIYVGSNPSAGIASPGNTNICELGVLTFPITNISTNSPGTKYVILFNDGTQDIFFDQTSTLTSVTHIYPKTSCGTTSNGIANSFIAKIEASNPCASTQGSVTPIYVSGRPKPEITPSSDNTCVNLPVTFTNSSPIFKSVATNGICSNGARVWEISPATGFTVASGQTLGSTNNSLNPSSWVSSNTNSLNIKFNLPGVYTVRLILGGSSTCGSAFTETTICVNEVPVSSFTLNNTIGCLPLGVSTTNNSSTAVCGINTPSWSISYLNPASCSPNSSAFSVTAGSLTSNSPAFQFNSPGNYTIQLVTFAPNNACWSAPLTRTVTVKSPPNVSIQVPPNICSGLSTSITPVVNNCYSTNPIPNYLWSIGGAIPVSSTLSNPGPFQFITAGTQAITLSVTNECGTSSDTKSILVYQTPFITGSFSPPTSCGGTNGSIQLTGLTASSIYSVSYTKGGITTSLTATADISGIILITNLTAGTYTNVFVIQNGCTSNVLGPFVLNDPIAPATPTVSNNGPICSGNTLTFSATSSTAGVSYAWTGPNAFTSSLQNPTITNVTPAAAGTYTLTVSLSNCTSTNTTTVVINPTPNPPTVSAVGYCQDATPTALSANPTAGNTLNWYTAPSGGTSSATAPTPSTSSVGITSYYVSQTTPAGCESTRAQITVTISTTPNIASANAANPTTCLGAQGRIELTGLANNTSYQVYYTRNSTNVGPLNITSNATGLLIIPSLTAATYSNIRVQLGNCSSNIVGPFTLTDPSPPATPTVSNNGPICSGNTLTFSATSATAGVSYAWTGPNAFTSSLQNPTITNVTPAAAGTYTLTVSLSNCTSTNTTTVVINPTPQRPLVSDVHYCKDEIASPLSATAQSGASLIWYNVLNGGIPLPIAPTPNTNTLGNTDYFVSQISQEGCEGLRSKITVSVTGIPVANSITDKFYCSESVSDNIVFTANISGTTFSWTNSNQNIGLPSTGSGPISFTTVNTTPLPISGLISAIPSVGGCTGLPTSFIVTIYPKPILSSTLTPPPVCTGILFEYTSTSATPLVTYSWSRAAVSQIGNSAGSSNDNTGIIKEVLISTSQTPVSVLYRITLESNGCNNIQSVNLVINPNAKAQFTSTNIALCAPGVIDDKNVKATDFPLANLGYRWLADNNQIGNNLIFPGYTIALPNDSVKIQLIANSRYNCKADTSEQIFRTIAKPTPKFDLSTRIGCGPLEVSFTNTTTPQPYQQFNYTWRFGNGVISNLKDPSPVTFQPSVSHKDTVYYITLTAALQCDTITTLRDSVIVRSKPIALFQPDTTVGCTIITSPFTFKAFNISIGKPNTYYWNFGDNSFDTTFIETPVTHIFRTFTTTTYTISLTAKNECGSSKDSIKIIVYPRDIFAKLFVEGPNNWGCAPDTVTFRNVSTGANRYEINFGDGSPDSIYVSAKSVETIKHLYRNPGIYRVSMKASNGCENTDTTIYLTIQMYGKPDVLFTTDKNSYCLKEPISFNNRSALGYNYQWDFGDGNTSNGFSPIHTYSLPGSYQVKLIVRSINANGTICSDSITKIIKINPLPILILNSNLQARNCAPFKFSGNANQPAGVIVNWLYSDPLSADTTSIGNLGGHTFSQSGTFAIRIIAINLDGCRDTGYLSANVIASPKTDFISSDTIKCFKSDTITFTNKTTYAGLDAVAYTWKVNDTSKKSTTNFIYDFQVPFNINSPVIYRIKLIAENSFGCKDSISKNASFLPPSQANISIPSRSGCAPFNLSITNNSLFADTYSWYLNDTLVSNLPNPTNIVLTRPATNYTIKLVANRNPSCQADSSISIVSTFEKPLVNFSSAELKPACTGNLQLQFTDLSIGNLNPITQWFWDFGDGTKSSLKNPSYNYTLPEKYLVKHAVTNDKGCKSDTMSRYYTNFGKPTVRFSLTDACLGTSIRPIITQNNPGFGSTTIAKYFWDFGDGTTDTTATPSHRYLKEGQYTIKLIVISDSSCISDSSSSIIRILGKPIADFSFTNNCINLPVFFIDKSSLGFGQPGNTLYEWDFGDGSARSNVQNPIHTYKRLGTFNIRLIVSSLLCPNVTDTLQRLINIVTGRAGVVYPRIITSRNLPLQLAAQLGGISYKWTPPRGLNNDSIRTPIAIYRTGDPNSIFYTIEIKDSSGCILFDQQEVWIFSEPDIQAPTAFTPNGDGANDRFIPVYIEIARIQFFRIFDRWGKLIFETSDMGQPWDGTYQGKPLPMDTFVFVVTGIDKKGNTITRKGNVTLIRD